ncbi:YmfQ family protein [Clostridium botulinum]|nr:YmfQ family protein [Clostridium botulinum]
MLKVTNLEIENIDNLIQDLYKQCFIKTATWGLKFWEENLEIKTDINKTYEERRSIILAKLRGQGTTTKKMMQSVAQSFVDGIVEVIEKNQDYAFQINIESMKGFPYKLDSLYNAINEIKPAHLGTQYNLKSTTKDKIKFASITRCAEEITVYPWNPKNTSVKGKIYIPISNNRSLETITIYPGKRGN